MVRNNLAMMLAVLFVLGAPSVDAGGGRGNASSQVCEDAGLIGSAYAACHTYCEALDCDEDDHSASENACNRAFERFLELSGGQQPPCVEEDDDGGLECPCSFGWNEGGYLPSTSSFADCRMTDDGEFGGSVSLTVWGEAGEYGQISAGLFVMSDGIMASSSFSCIWDASSASGVGSGIIGVSNVGDDGSVWDDPRISLYYAACRDRLLALAAAHGFDEEACLAGGGGW